MSLSALSVISVVKEIKTSMNRSTDKVWYTQYHGIFFSLKKEGNSALSLPATNVLGPSKGNKAELE